MLSGIGALLDIPRERFPFNVVGNYKFNSCWGEKKVMVSQKKKSSLKGLTPVTNMCFLITGKFLVQGKNALLYK